MKKFRRPNNSRTLMSYYVKYKVKRRLYVFLKLIVYLDFCTATVGAYLEMLSMKRKFNLLFFYKRFRTIMVSLKAVLQY